MKDIVKVKLYLSEEQGDHIRPETIISKLENNMGVAVNKTGATRISVGYNAELHRYEYTMDVAVLSIEEYKRLKKIEAEYDTWMVYHEND